MFLVEECGVSLKSFKDYEMEVHTHKPPYTDGGLIDPRLITDGSDKRPFYHVKGTGAAELYMYCMLDFPKCVSADDAAPLVYEPYDELLSVHGDGKKKVVEVPNRDVIGFFDGASVKYVPAEWGKTVCVILIKCSGIILHLSQLSTNL